ncbi:Cytoplasmic tRNA 2-thiolation protein 2 [Lobosporangium transversale]|uniref:Cytoplasmic tRNA 2-thiolation protein 2 n=1 Tax=Lobosporangium transversale TaxID=64571 RepID=A0A1Y2G1X0_9FUNG|nr:hypothetical protein BCR41DRAFT_427076 [Lobosporangium transversale]KAF9914756.1 Cytoplasmic tRNA 2-thiolation protein 2 [Lobosporangium transversale]ORY89581.1 hypothetical protein BCR41DRAFT_427076 [Lobosporangium transversale]|eukprot:XP_021875070.1 hypothetical protein BCR41DRAFT_427076 [Lobosporangium transversale]
MSCSIDEPTMTVAEKRAKARAVHVGFCCKCKTTRSTIIVRYAEYCDPCFLIALDSKFRTALRNARPYRVTNPENVMLAFSGGSSSRSLIHLFDVFHSLPPEVTSNKQQPKIYNDIHVCHVDESCLFEPSSLQTQIQSQGQNDSHSKEIKEEKLDGSTMEQARSIAAHYNYLFHGVRIEDIYDPEWADSHCFEAVATLVTSLPKDQLAISGEAPELLSHIHPMSPLSTSSGPPGLSSETTRRQKMSRQEKIAKLKALLAACTTLTAKETILGHIRSSLLAQLAKRADCTILALGDSATRVAIQIIGLTAIGRGFSLPHETSLESNWIQGCKVIRPLKDCLAKELDTLCRLSNLEVIEKHTARLGWTIQSKGEIKSIKQLTEEFIIGLDKDFPSTAATVCRTAAKLTPPDVQYQDKCPLCHGPVQAGVQEWKKRITVTTPPSRDDQETAKDFNDTCCSSTVGTSCCSNSNRSINSSSSCTQNSTKSHSTDEKPPLPFSSLLCYGCLTNLRDLNLKSMGSLNGDETSQFELPPYVAWTILDRVGYKSLEDYENAFVAKDTDVDPRESLREQIQEFLIASDSESEE